VKGGGGDAGDDSTDGGPKLIDVGDDEDQVFV